MSEQAKQFEVLPGLPTCGPLAESFSATGQGRHREGYVVRFFPREGESWVGNFQPGIASLCCVVEHPDGTRLIVISGGEGYVVDPANRKTVEFMASWYVAVHRIQELNQLVFETPVDFEAIGESGKLWCTHQVSWDGMRNVVVCGCELRGEAWGLDDCWYPFRVDLRSGMVDGGSYKEPDR